MGVAVGVGGGTPAFKAMTTPKICDELVLFEPSMVPVEPALT